MPAPSLLLLAALLGAPHPSGPGSTGEPSQDPLPLRVDWTAEPSCPDAEALRVELVRLLHRELRFDPEAEARVEGVIRRRDGAFELALSVAAGELHERRTLRAGRCDELRTAAALVVALALEPWAAGVAPRSVPEPEGAPVEVPPVDPGEPATAGIELDPGDDSPTRIGVEEPGEPVPPARELGDDGSLGLAPPGPAPSPRPSERRFGRVGLLVHGGLGVAQHAVLAGGLGGALAVLGRGWRLELTGIHWWPARVDVADGVSVRARLSAGGVRGCWAPDRGRWELPLCGGLEVGAMRASATGPGITTITSRGPWLGLLAGVGAAWRATRWLAMRASVDLTVAAWRPTFHLQQGPTVVPVLTPPPVGARVLAGVELRLPPWGE